MASKPPLKRIVTMLAALLLAWPALVVLVATPLAELLLPKIHREQTGRELRLGEVVLNPFMLRATLRNASSRDPDGQPFWSLRELTIDFSAASLWRRALVLDAVRLDGIALRIEQLAADRYNFSDILDHRADHFPPADTAGDGTLPPLELRRIELDIASLDTRLPYIAEPLTAAFANLRLTIDAFTTRPEGHARAAGELPPLASGALRLAFDALQLQSLRAEEPWESTVRRFDLGFDRLTTIAEAGQPYRIDAQFADGGSLQWRGELSLAAQRSSGEIALDGINLRPLWRYLQPQLNFRASSAGNRIDLQSRYSVSWHNGLRWALDDGRLALHDTDLRARDDADSRLQMARLAVDGIRANGERRSVEVGRVQLDGLALQSWNRDSEVGLLAMLQPRTPATAAATTTPAATTPAAATAATATGAAAGSTPWQLTVGEVAASDARIRWRASQLDVEQLDVTPLSFSLRQLRWPSDRPAQLSLTARINDRTQLGVEGELNPGTLDGQLRGEIDGLPLTWGNRLLGQQLKLTLADGTLATTWQLQLAQGRPASAEASGAISRFELRRQGVERRLAAWRELRWQTLAFNASDNRLTLAEVALQQPYLQFRLYEGGTTNFHGLAATPTETVGAAAAAQPGGEPAAEASTGSRPLQLAVGAVRIADGTLDFRDDTLPRPFRARIGELSGDILDLSSERGRHATIDLAGAVDGYAPVTLAGRAAPLADRPELDLTLDFANLDLANFTPYSANYAGYVIDRGQLSVQLAYRLEQNRIQGSNRIVVDQLKLGERVSSPQALDLPLRLAIALLTDSKGVMEIGVDISGDLDDPQFDLGGIVWQAFRNLIVKTATAPFRFLANLTGSKQKLAFIVFEPGSDALNPLAHEKLQTLRTALERRTDLRLLVSGQTEDAADLPALRRQQRDELLQEAGLSAADLDARGRAWRRAAEALYRQLQPEADPDPLDDSQLAEALAAAVPLRPTALRALASRRAATVKRALVTEYGVPAERVFIDSGKRQTIQMPRATMALDVL
jgi:outer membrane protein OmpA-like peptidoglycan-associated protein